MKCSAKPSTAGPNRLPDKTGAWRKETKFASFNLHHREPEVALQHYKAGNRTLDGLGGGFGGT